MSGYEVILQPALFIALGLVVIATLVRGTSRPVVDTRSVNGVEIPVRRVEVVPGTFRKAGIRLLVGVALLAAIVVTPPGHRGVIYSATGGVNAGERVEGVSLIIPFYQTATQIDVRTQKFFTDAAFAQSSDLQEITVVGSVNYRVDPTRASELYADVGKSYEETVLAPAFFQLVKQEVGQIKAVDFALAREALARDIAVELQQQMEPFGIVIEFVNIEDAVFDGDFIRAVKEKVIAAEEALEQQNLIAAEAAKKEQVIIQAQAEAERLLTEAAGQREAIEEIAAALGFTPEEYLTYQLLLNWDGTLPTTLVGDGTGLDLLLNIQ